MVVRDKSPVGGGKKSKKNREDKGNKKGKSDKTKKTNQNRERSPFDVIEVNTANSDGFVRETHEVRKGFHQLRAQ